MIKRACKVASDIILLIGCYFSRSAVALQKPITLLFIPGLSMLMTYPVFHHTRIYTLNGSTPDKQVSFCIEDWQLSSSNQSNYDPSTRLPYSIFSMVFQFGIPFVFISAIYISIYGYLKKHRSVKQ